MRLVRRTISGTLDGTGIRNGVKCKRPVLESASENPELARSMSLCCVLLYALIACNTHANLEAYLNAII